MVPYGLTQAQFQTTYQRKLEGLSKQAIAQVSTLLSIPIAPDVDEAHVEIFLGEDGGSPDVWMYWRGKNNKVDHADPSLFAGRSMHLKLGLEILAELDEQYFRDPDQFPGLELVVPILARWVAECWWKAGGWKYLVPVMLTVHDFGTCGSVSLSEGRA
jgi:hypothetical protein